jgi:hypothetical protein
MKSLPRLLNLNRHEREYARRNDFETDCLQQSECCAFLRNYKLSAIRRFYGAVWDSKGRRTVIAQIVRDPISSIKDRERD